ncbi:hypothetical protein [Nitrincola sp. MINF-07-Sa-05]|uniref:hypothetical protein n=1 Tax=Nitrincola salilacus TaxID=3400273 RepID=UPI003917EE71
MSDYFVNFPDFARTYLPEDLLIPVFSFLLMLGFIFQLASFFYSVLRITRDMKRDGIEPPPLHWLNIAGYMSIFLVSRRKIEKMIKTERDAGVTKHRFGLICTAVVVPYIKPIDRFLTRGMFALCGVGIPVAIIHWWLYPY